MLLNRRDILAIAAAATGSAAFAGLGLPPTGSSEDLRLVVPDRVLRGTNTQIAVHARGATRLRLYSDEQPETLLASFRYGNGSADVCAALTVCLQQSQTIVAQADLQNGQTSYAAAYVAVIEKPPSA